jgi:acyl-coenzyme A thioesterase PaaI-like protein
MTSDVQGPVVLDAMVRFLRPEEGGRFSAPADGVRSQLHLGEVMTSCVVRNADGARRIPLGVEIPVHIELMFGNTYESEVRRLATIELYEGKKLVARGRAVDPRDS